MSEGVKSSMPFSVSVESGLLSPCGFSRDRVDIACIMVSAMRGMSASVKLGMGPVECAALLIKRVGRPAVELLRACFPGRLLPSLSTSRGTLRDLVL